MKLIPLSYELSKSTPSYGNKHKVTVKQIEKISKGDTSNSYEMKIYNHIGTHVDCPNHFYDNGKKIDQYNIDDFIFKSPQLIDVTLKENHMISKQTITKELNKETDIFLFRTYFSKVRESEEYINHYPYFCSNFATHLKNNFPKLRAIGMDIISLTSPINKKEGKKSHEILLDQSKSEPILIIEDMFLENFSNEINKIMISPFFVKGIDSAPCNVYGII